jgi:hypothetical protein
MSTEQTLYFDQKGLLRRHDYHVEISGGIGAAHYVSDLGNRQETYGLGLLFT